MVDYLSKEEHGELRHKMSEGKTRVTLPRNLARQFFFKVGRGEVRDVTGESIALQKLGVLLSLFTSFVLIVTCLVLIVYEFGWLSMLALPLTGIFWTIIVGFTTELGNLIATAVGFVIVTAIALLAGEPYLAPLLLFSISIVLFRISHIMAQYFLIDLIVDSFDAYDMLAEHIIVEDTDINAA